MNENKKKRFCPIRLIDLLYTVQNKDLVIHIYDQDGVEIPDDENCAKYATWYITDMAPAIDKHAVFCLNIHIAESIDYWTFVDQNAAK